MGKDHPSVVPGSEENLEYGRLGTMNVNCKESSLLNFHGNEILPDLYENLEMMLGVCRLDMLVWIVVEAKNNVD